MLAEARRLYDSGFEALAEHTITRFLTVDLAEADRPKVAAARLDMAARDLAATRQWFNGRDGGWTPPERLARRDNWLGMDFYHADADKARYTAVVVPFDRNGAQTVVPKGFTVS